jgi:hypothetical protein
MAVSDAGDAPTCNEDGTSVFPDYGVDSQQRLLMREGVIDDIPANICAAHKGKPKKNVILVIGDGMWWEMVRAGTIAHQVIHELKTLGCNTKVGCPDNKAAKDAFEGRTLGDYYTEGRLHIIREQITSQFVFFTFSPPRYFRYIIASMGYGLSFQELAGYALVTTAAPVLQAPNAENHYAPENTLLEGSARRHKDRSAPLFMNECGFPHEFNPNSLEDGGAMANWNDAMGGEFPWDNRYYQENPDISDRLDPEFILLCFHRRILRHWCQGSWRYAFPELVRTRYAYHHQGGHEVWNGRRSRELRPHVPCHPCCLHPHSNNRSNHDQLCTSWLKTNPTMVSGVCGARYYPFAEDLQSMCDGWLSLQWTLFEQNDMIMAVVRRKRRN